MLEGDTQAYAERREVLGREVNRPCGDWGIPPLMYAIVSERPKAVQLLLDCGASPGVCTA